MVGRSPSPVSRSKAVYTRSYSLETKRICDLNYFTITNASVTRIRTRSYWKVIEITSLYYFIMEGGPVSLFFNSMDDSSDEEIMIA